MQEHTPQPTRALKVITRFLPFSRCILTALAFIAGLLVFTPNQGHSQATAEASLSLQILSEQDRDLYRRIFELQEAGDWPAADKLIAQVSDPLLIGHVKFQRYMHPTKYRSSFSELSRWMSNYAGHPGANRIYRLARKRQGSARTPKAPLPAVNNNGYSNGQPAAPKAKPKVTRSKSDKSALARFDSRFSREIWRNRPGRAEKRLWAFEAREIFSEPEFVKNLTTLAENYFFNGDDEKAYALASLAVEISSQPLTQANWIAGIAAWRSGICGGAIAHFSRLAQGATDDPWILSAGAFWTARSYIKCRQPDQVAHFLKIAARHKDTFYGLIAMRQLGMEPKFVWDPVPLTDRDYQTLASLEGVRRAIALAGIGEYSLADQELRLIWTRKQHHRPEDIIALAAKLDLPASQILIAKEVSQTTALPDSPFYPVPLWQPEGGYKIDRALMLGFMRQESHFLPRAHSGAGAYGLMQLMPSTASFISGDRSLRWSGKYKLLIPEVNMGISQTYMLKLFEDRVTDGNLLKFATAYNGGPGNLGRWENRIDYNDDPLLFIETIPYRETRNFIEKVIANMWIYRMRFGQPTPSLDAAAAGAWPVYEALDKEFYLAQKEPAAAALAQPAPEGTENAQN